MKNNDSYGLGFSSTKEGESSKSDKERSNKGNKSKPTFHNCGKVG